MEDSQIIALYLARDEQAIAQTSRKYDSYCHTISYRILSDHGEASECVNDTWLRTWYSIPPQQPNALPPFLAKIVRNLSIDRFRRLHAKKRTAYTESLDELAECLGSGGDLAQGLERQELASAVNRFLHGLSQRDCGLFLDRYFYFRSMEEAAERWGVSATHAAVLLHRIRKKLHKQLEKEGLL